MLVVASEKILFYRRSCPVILQRLENDPYANYCIQYAGNGHYYKTQDEALEYVRKRWKRIVTPAQ